MTYSNLTIPTPCLDLAMEGERFCREGDWNKGISYFLKALAIGTDDLSCLSVVYCQLGNAYFYQQDYARALEYHRWNLALARRMGDGIGEAFATGNLGNTLQMMGKYDEAIMCFSHELTIARHLNDKRTEAGALYNLGSVYQAKGKQWLPDSGEFPADAVKAQRKAAEYYKMGLELVRVLGDRPAEGRALGSLANAYYLLSNFTEAIECYRERLKIAKEFGDLTAQRRAHSNIGNAFIFLADFNAAVEHYREALQLSVRLKDTSLEAQACFSLGNTYILLREPGTAVVFLLRHLIIARGLSDRIGEGRAHWSLANAYTALKRYDLALRCSKRHRRIACQLGDTTGYMTAQLMIGEICNLMTNIQIESSTLIGASNENDQMNLQSNNSNPTINYSSVQQSCLLDINNSKLNENILFLKNNHKLPCGTNNNKCCIDVNNNSISTTTTTISNPTNIILTNSTCTTNNFSNNSSTDLHINDENNNSNLINGLISQSLLNSSSKTIDPVENIDIANSRIEINSSQSTVTSNFPTTTIPSLTTVSTNIIDSNHTTENHSHKLVIKNDNGDDDDNNNQDDLDLELDKDLENELLENYEGILETVEFVTVTEDGQTVISQMGCLDVPTPVLSESKKENMVEFYLSAPSFRPSLSQQIDIPNLQDIEGNLESIESMSQMNRNSNLSSENLDSGNAYNTVGTSSSAVTVAAASLVEEERSVDQQEMFFSLLLESQSRRMDEQRCYLRTTGQGTPPIQSIETSNAEESNNVQLSSGNPRHTPDYDNSSLRNQIGTNEEAFFDLIEGVQGARMNDQRANLSVFPGLRSGPGLHLLDNNNDRYFGSTSSVFKSTSSCASDGLPEPRLRNNSSNNDDVTGVFDHNSTTTTTVPATRASYGGGETGRAVVRGGVGSTVAGSDVDTRGRRGHIVSSTGDLDDEFLEMIFRIQTCTRINDQRTNLPDPLTQVQSHTNPTHHNNDNGEGSREIRQPISTSEATTSNSHRELTLYTSSGAFNNLTNRYSVPAVLDNEDDGDANDLFALIQRVQSTRLDEQRCHPPL
uniref:G-protein signalling modulator, putative n=3 Tax=Schistosoma mansoni TaxID=6183 RepID=A0A3Q0KUB3_SCHMA